MTLSLPTVGTDHNQWGTKLNAWLEASQSGITNVLHYGAVGDGVTDDTAAIQAAIDAAGAAGGGIVFIPEGRYLVTPAGATGGARWCLAIIQDNITIQGCGASSVLVFDLSASADYTRLFSVSGAGKPEGMDGWEDHFWPYEPPYTGPTRYTINTASQGANTITTSTAAHAGNFAAGDWCYIFTGQTIEFNPPMQPDSEVNQVLSAVAGTGVITLRWPLSKPYAAENVDTGGGFTYRSIVGGAGSAVAIGVQEVSDSIVKHVAFRDFAIESLDTPAGDQGAFIAEQAYDVQIERISGVIAGALATGGTVRSMRVQDCTVHLKNTGYDYSIGGAVGATDFLASGNHISSDHVSYLHVHEGVAHAKFVNNVIGNTHVADPNLPGVSIQGRAYDIQIIGNTLRNCGSGYMIYVENDVCDGGGVIALNRIEGTLDGAIGIGSENWIVIGNDSPDNEAIHFFTSAIDSPVRVVSGLVTHDNQSVEIGHVPYMHAVLRVHVYVLEAFNSSGTDLLDVGVSGGLDIYKADVDVSTTGVKTAGDNWAIAFPLPEPKTIIATYANGGTEPSTGKVIITVEFASVRQAT